jgi:hypothetical protein
MKRPPSSYPGVGSRLFASCVWYDLAIARKRTVILLCCLLIASLRGRNVGFVVYGPPCVSNKEQMGGLIMPYTYILAIIAR